MKGGSVPHAIEIGYWDEDAELDRQMASRRRDEEGSEAPAAIASAESFAWAEVPERDNELLVKHFHQHAA